MSALDEFADGIAELELRILKLEFVLEALEASIDEGTRARARQWLVDHADELRSRAEAG